MKETGYERNKELFHSYKLQKEARETIHFKNKPIGARHRKTNEEIMATNINTLVNYMAEKCWLLRKNSAFQRGFDRCMSTYKLSLKWIHICYTLFYRYDIYVM